MDIAQLPRTPQAGVSSKMNVREFHVVPRLPPHLEALSEIAYNLWWTWHSDAHELFQRIDPEAFGECRHNPVQLLGSVSPGRLEELAEDSSFLRHLERVKASLDAYMESTPWFQSSAGQVPSGVIAYLCAEYGLHESLPIYSGGLGILAGDTLKSASDLGIPLVAVGLLYQQGYFEQRITAEGRQTEAYPEIDYLQTPMRLLRSDTGEPLTVEIELGARKVSTRVWQVQVGRVPLFLLDSNVPGAPEPDRQICARLYGGDSTLRLEQEVLLGVGAVRTLQVLGITPQLYHMNEGHSVLATLEQTANLMQRESLSFEQARYLAAALNVFTTHTPVPAGHDEFEFSRIRPYLEPLARRLQVPVNALLELGRPESPAVPPASGVETPVEAAPAAAAERFCMTVLGLRMSRFRNGVSQLHGQVSREMWKDFWPSLDVAEIPITHVTNGVHTPSWMAARMRGLYDRDLPPAWRNDFSNDSLWKHALDIPDVDLWNVRCFLRRRLVQEIRRRLQKRALRAGASPVHLRRALEALDPEVLTIAFCRRFATYKRATLLFRDLERLARILGNSERPMQIVFAGKAHPQDEPGKSFIHEIVENSQRPELLGRVVFLENYDVELARVLVQGADVWLNTPRRPLEASGTSGMKAAINGAVNLSVLDGWWCEGFHGDNGWAIGEAAPADSEAVQDELDAGTLYDLLEHEVAPRFYDRSSEGVPVNWLRTVKASIVSLCARFSSDRMMKEYATRFYRPALRAFAQLTGPNHKRMMELTEWWRFIHTHWGEVHVAEVDVDLGRVRDVGEEIPVTVYVECGPIDPKDLVVELLHGPVDHSGQLRHGATERARFTTTEQGRHCFYGTIPCRRTGRIGMAVRIRPATAGSDLLWDQTLFCWG